MTSLPLDTNSSESNCPSREVVVEEEGEEEEEEAIVGGHVGG